MPLGAGFDKFWAYDYLDEIIAGDYYLANANEWIEDIIRVNTKEIYIKYGQYKVSCPFTESEFETFISELNYKHLYENAYLRSAKRTMLQMMALMALWEKWDEFQECLNWRQPDSANANYLGEKILPETYDELFILLSSNNAFYENYPFFYEREGLAKYVIQASSHVLLWLYQKNSQLTINVNVFKDKVVALRILEALLSDLKMRFGETGDFQELISSYEKLVESNKNIVQENQKMIGNGRGEFIRNLCTNYMHRSGGFLNLFDIKAFSSLINNEDCISRYTISHGLSSYDGVDIYIDFISKIFSSLKIQASIGRLEDINEMTSLIVFSDSERLLELGFSEPDFYERGLVVWNHPSNSAWKGVLVNSENTVFLNPNEIDIHATYFESGSGKLPLLITTDETNPQAPKVSAYIYLEILNPNNSVFIC